MSIGTILQHHRITLKNLHKLVHLTGKKRGGGCLGCHCKTPKYAAWGTVRFGPMPESTLIARKLCSLSLVLAASPAYLAKTPMKSIDDLDAGEHVLFTPTTATQAWSLFNGDQTHEFGRPARFASNNYGAVRDVALAGGGVALLSEFMVSEDLTAGRLVRVLPEWSTKQTEVHAVYPARHNLPPRLTLFLDHLAKALSPPPWDR